MIICNVYMIMQLELTQTSYMQSPMYASDAALNNERGFSTFGALGIHVSHPRYVSSKRTAEIHNFNQKMPINLLHSKHNTTNYTHQLFDKITQSKFSISIKQLIYYLHTRCSTKCASRKHEIK